MPGTTWHEELVVIVPFAFYSCSKKSAVPTTQEFWVTIVAGFL